MTPTFDTSNRSDSIVGRSEKPPIWSALANVKLLDFRALTVQQVYASLVRFCFIAIIVSNNIDISRSARSDEAVSLSFQVVLKLVLVGLSLVITAWGLVSRPSLFRALETVPGALVLLLAIWHFVTCLTAVMPTVALASALAFAGLMFLTIANLQIHGPKQVFFDCMLGMAIYVILGIALGFVMPELTMFQEYISITETVSRFGGLGHPNALGAYVVLCLVLAIGLALDREISWRWPAAMSVLCLYILMLAISRTPLIAGTIAIGAIVFPRLTAGMKLSLLASLMLIPTALLFFSAVSGDEAVQDKLLASVTKTGDAEELTSATGRTQIWAYALTLIAERPLMGWGSGSTPVVMAGVSGHSHNILLQPTVTLGFPGGILVALILLYNAWILISTRSATVRGIAVFLLILGSVESVILGPFPSGTTLIWLAATLFVPVIHQFVRNERLA